MLLAGACDPSSDDRVRAEPALRVRDPEVTPRAETPLRGRVLAVLAGADGASPANAAARPDPRAPQVRVPVTTVLVIPDLSPTAAMAEPGPAQVVSFATGALLTPTPTPTYAAPIQGLPASPQSYGSVRSNFGPTGTMFGGSFAAPSYGSSIR